MSDSNDQYYTAEEDDESITKNEEDDRVPPGFCLHTSPNGTVWIIPSISIPPLILSTDVKKNNPEIPSNSFEMEMGGFDPPTSRMQSERSTD